MATALVTGGTSGIGAAFARAYAARGYDLVLVARDEERLTATARLLAARHGVLIDTLPADLSVREDVLRVADRLTDPSRPIDVLVNNAGFGIHTSLLAEDTTPIERGMDVMCRAVLMLGAAAGRTMRARGQGRIINVSSLAGHLSMGAYSAVKAWVTAYSESLAVELRGTGVAVTALCPGWVRTEFHTRAGIRTTSIPDALWIDADPLVRAAIADSSRGKALSVPSVRYKVIGVALRHLPRPVIRRISGLISSRRRESTT